MPHLSLAKARVGAANITHNRYPGLRLKVQFGRCFVLDNRRVLAAATTWDEALEHLLQAQVVQAVSREGLDVPAETEFGPLAQLYLSDYQAFKTKYTRRAEGSVVVPPGSVVSPLVAVNPTLPADVGAV